MKKKEAARSSSLIMSGRVRRLNSDWRDEAPDHDLFGNPSRRCPYATVEGCCAGVIARKGQSDVNVFPSGQVTVLGKIVYELSSGTLALYGVPA